jgi:hypothetical protein
VEVNSTQFFKYMLPFSIGCLLFQCLSGFTPFSEASLCRLFLHVACGNFDGYEVFLTKIKTYFIFINRYLNYHRRQSSPYDC